MAVKPDRPPDYVQKPGHAYWWPEMIFMHVYGGVHVIQIDQENGSLYYMDLDLKQGLNSHIKEVYDKWWYETFEAKFLGDSDE